MASSFSNDGGGGGGDSIVNHHAIMVVVGNDDDDDDDDDNDIIIMEQDDNVVTEHDIIIPTTTSSSSSSSTTTTTTTIDAIPSTTLTIPTSTTRTTAASTITTLVADAATSVSTTTTSNTCTDQTTKSTIITTSTTTTKSNNNNIQLIPPATVRRIVAGPAIYDLASCVKELIDNAIDAYSTTINIRLYNKGLDIIEVSDDGIGIDPESYPYIALPHATSKIRHFSDIYYHNNRNNYNNNNNNHNTNTPTTTSQPPQQEQEQDTTTTATTTTATLGFRGEALHCIANISQQLLVATRTCHDKVATKMEFQNDGTLNTNTITTISRKIGTTVAVMKLFYHLPVRYKDYMIHIQEQRTKLIQLIIGYAIFLSYRNIRFHIMDINSKNGRERSLFITPYYPPSSNITLKDSVSSILGCNILNHLTEIMIDISSYVSQAKSIVNHYDNSNEHNDNNNDDDNKFIVIPNNNNNSNNNNSTTTDHTATWTLKGLISAGPTRSTIIPKPNTNTNTSTKNKNNDNNHHHHNNKPVHYFAINSRPVDIPIISRLINKVYKTMCRSSNNNNNNASPLTTCTCILEFTLPLHIYDINLSPDKRKVQFWNDTILYNIIEQSLTQFWSTTTTTTTTTTINTNEYPTTECVNHIPPTTTLMSQPPPPPPPKQHTTAARRNTSFSCSKASLVTTTSQTSSKHQNLDNEYDDDDDSIDAFDHNDSHTTTGITTSTARRVSSIKGREDTMNSSFHSVYSNESFSSVATMNRSFSRRYAFVHDPQQSIQKQQEYGGYETCNLESSALHDNEEKELTPLSSGEMNSVGNTEGDEDSKLKITAPDRPKDVDQMDHSISVQNRSSSVPVMSSETESSSSNFKSHLTVPATANAITTKERRQFQEIQQRFRRSDSHDSTSLLQLESTLARSDSDPTIPQGQNHDRSFVPPRKSSSSLFDRFGYKGSDTVKSKVNVTTTVDRNQSTETQQYVKRPRTTEDNEPLSRAVALQKSKSTKVGASVVDSANVVEPIQKDEAAVPTPSTIMWQGVTSEDVVMASIHDRIAMIQRKRQRNGPHVSLSSGNTGVLDDVSVTIPNMSISTDTNIPSQNNRIKHDSNHLLCKADLQNMQVIGQFNLGFILAMTPDNNVWILDQHACDERYNFEKLQKQSNKFFEQPLIAPLPLELSYMEEACIVDNMKLFEQNGFRLQYDETKPSRYRFSLLAVPHSGAPDGRNAVQYGKQDVQDICAILLGRSHRSQIDDEDEVDDMYSFQAQGGTGTDGSGLYGNNAVRRFAASGSMMSQTQPSTFDEAATAEQIIAQLPKTIAMFASRACRNSIMIGKALSTKEMEKVIQHLSHVDTPWMCAHGRPTICHANVVGPQQQQQSSDSNTTIATMIQMDDRIMSEHIAGPTITCSTQQDDTLDDIDDEE